MPLNRSPDGPLAFSDSEEMSQYDVTKWLIEYVEDNNETNGGSWSDWSSAQEIVGTYEPAYDGKEFNSQIGSYHEHYYPDLFDLGERATSILEACIAGADQNDLMTAWLDEIQAQSLSGPSI